MKKHVFQLLIFCTLLIILAGCSNGSNLSSMPTVFPSPMKTYTNMPSLVPLESTATLTPSAIPQPAFDGRIAFLNISRNYTKLAILDLKTLKIQDINNMEVDRAFDALSWSPDGEWIAVGGMYPEYQNSQLLITNPNGALMNLPFYPHGANPDWSSDGKQILYNGENGIAIFDMFSGKIYQLTNPTGLAYYPIWSPDETRIAYIYNQKTSTGDAFDQQWELWTMDSNGKNPHPVIDSKSIMHSPIDWSPNGEWIAFVSFDNLENGTANACGDIYIVRFDGSDLTRLTNLEECATSISWSPDGNRIAFIGRNRKNNGDIMKSGWQIYVMDPNGKNIAQVTNESEWVLYSLDWGK